MNYIILLPVILPIIAGAGLILIPQKVFNNRKSILGISAFLMIISVIPALIVIFSASPNELRLFELVDGISIYFAADKLGKLFAAVVTLIFVLAGIFSFAYMEHEKNEKRYYGFYLITYGVLMGLDFAGNLVTMYVFYELMTLASAPLVIHTCSRESIMAGLKYMFYSFCGAYMALFGIYLLNRFSYTLDFVAGGSLNMELLAQTGSTGLMLVAAFLMIIGFGVKAGCFPFHAWLPTAHPVAPSPASAFLSGIIVKGGVLAIIRAVYYCIGIEFIRNTWVQQAWIILAAITVVMGSALAYKEKILKKRFAYSTVSNLSYILLGLAMLNSTAFTGSILHVVFHAIIKSALFMFAGAVIFTTGRVKTKYLAGLGKSMPVLFGAYIVVSLGLIGIPPTSGVISKWYLATGALQADVEVLSWIAPAALLLSALLTAGYLLPIGVKAFLINPTDGNDYKDPSALMLVPIIILAVITVVLGIFPTPLIDFIAEIGDVLMIGGLK